MYNVMQILNADNWCALAVAICYRQYLSPENAISMYDTGDLSKSKGVAGNGIENYRAIAYMKNQNMSWREIGETLGLKSPASYFCKLKNKYGGGSGPNRQQITAAANQVLRERRRASENERRAREFQDKFYELQNDYYNIPRDVRIKYKDTKRGING